MDEDLQILFGTYQTDEVSFTLGIIDLAKKQQSPFSYPFVNIGKPYDWASFYLPESNLYYTHIWSLDPQNPWQWIKFDVSQPENVTWNYYHPEKAYTEILLTVVEPSD